MGVLHADKIVGKYVLAYIIHVRCYVYIYVCCNCVWS